MFLQEEINELKAKITKLAQSLSFLIEEKSHTETQFQLERKQLIQQNTQVQKFNSLIIVYTVFIFIF